MILLLHTLIMAFVGLMFLFYPEVGDLVPGYGTAEGDSFQLLIKSYGVTGLFLAGLSLYAWLRRTDDRVFLVLTAALSAYHYAMILVQMIYNSDQRAGLLHFLLAIFLTAQYLGRRRESWGTTDTSDV